MSEAVKEWIIGMVGASAISCIALTLTPKGRVYEVVRLLCGVLVAITMLSPVISFDYTAYAENLSKYREEYTEITTEASADGDRLVRTLIEQECSAYILDKAGELGVQVSGVTVTAKWGDDNCWYPYEANISSQQERNDALTGVIEAQLGIPAERQYWS